MTEEKRMKAEKVLKQSLKVLLIIAAAVIGIWLFIKIIVPIAVLFIIIGAFGNLSWAEMFFITHRPK